jgi:hypothetical protein
MIDKIAVEKKLRTYPVKELAEWYCKLNISEWPGDFPFPLQFPDQPPPEGEAWQYMEIIEGMIGRKETLRWWNQDAFWCGARKDIPLPDYYTGPPINTGPMSDEEFEAFWKKARHP